MRLILALLVISLPLGAALPKPGALESSPNGPTAVFHWSEVEGASVYRVAVFAAPDEEGKRELVAAVWVKGLSWAYGNGKVVPRVGKLPSKIIKPLQPGATYKLMVYAAEAEGTNKSDWVSTEFVAPGADVKVPARQAAEASSTPTFTPTPTPTSSPTPAVDAKSGTGPAELEVDLAAEFKESPEAGETGLSKTALPLSIAGARALLQQGKADEAETVYKALLEKDAADADAWEGLGDSYDARKMRVEAKEAYEKALAIDKKRERLKKWMDENVKR